MDIHPMVKNGRLSSWTIRPEVEVAITLLREYYVGRGIVIRVTSTDSLLALVSIREVSDALDMLISFPVQDITRLN